MLIDINRFISHIATLDKEIGCLINAAGYFNSKSFVEHTEQD